MTPVLYPTPFRDLWAPVMARVYHGLLPDRMDALTHGEIGSLLEDFERVAGGAS